MKIGNIVLDTDNLTVDELSEIITKLRKVRDCKKEAVAIGHNLQDMMNRTREKGYLFCNKSTGEVLNETDWVVFCEETRTIEEWNL